MDSLNRVHLWFNINFNGWQKESLNKWNLNVNRYLWCFMNNIFSDSKKVSCSEYFFNLPKNTSCNKVLNVYLLGTPGHKVKVAN